MRSTYFVVLVACASPHQTPALDAPPVTQDGSGSSTLAGTPVVCDKTATITDSTPILPQVTTFQFATFPTDPSATYQVLLCGETIGSAAPSTSPFACPAGHNCSSSGDALPTGQQCYFATPVLYGSEVFVACRTTVMNGSAVAYSQVYESATLFAR